MANTPGRSVLWKFWIVGGFLTAAVGFLVLALFLLDAGRQVVPGVLGALFVVIGLIAAIIGWTKSMSR
ncbi:hypothetical protein [Microbacterium sp. T32]|uniref:hypothetical protein n=1 Tax=Microbacterium sp. T32 TaxID=1776083 RepID=UPI0007ABF549|nr:hypothetical protein [Microbacterium sp. T32]KZE40544.1 hypothetical protein AVW09_14895 [Microbacterium sp. T32]